MHLARLVSLSLLMLMWLNKLIFVVLYKSIADPQIDGSTHGKIDQWVNKHLEKAPIGQRTRRGRCPIEQRGEFSVRPSERTSERINVRANVRPSFLTSFLLTTLLL